MLSLFSPLQYFYVLRYKISSINWKQMLLEKKNRYDQRTDYNPVFSHRYGNTYLEQFPLFITPKPKPLLRSWNSARSTCITWCQLPIYEFYAMMGLCITTWCQLPLSILCHDGFIHHHMVSVTYIKFMPWWVYTSPYGVSYLFEFYAMMGLDIKQGVSYLAISILCHDGFGHQHKAPVIPISFLCHDGFGINTGCQFPTAIFIMKSIYVS